MGCAQVIATELFEDVLELLQDNVDRNTDGVEVERLLWGDKEAVDAFFPPFDVVVLADCVYEAR